MGVLGEKEVGDAGKHSGNPAESRDEGGPPQVWEGEQVEGVADGQVALRGEGDDGEDARIGSAVAKGSFGCFEQVPPFGEETSQTTEDAAEGPGVLMPIQQQLIGKTCNKSGNIIPKRDFLMRRVSEGFCKVDCESLKEFK